MMISGKKKIISSTEGNNKKCGIFVGNVIKICPDNQWFSDNNMELKEGSRAAEYLVPSCVSAGVSSR